MLKLTILVIAVGIFSFNCHASIKMAITVDDLPVHGDLPPGMTRTDVAKKYVEILKKHKVPEVYGFVNAGRTENKDDTAKVLKIWQDAGYPVGNHTYSHMSLNKNSAADFVREIALDDDYLKQVSGGKDWKYFRYPYLHEGDTLAKRNAVRKYLQENHYKIAQVTIDFEDWSWNNPYARCVAKNDKKSIEWLKESYLKNASEILISSDKVSTAVFKKPISHVLLIHIGAFDALVLDQMLTDYEKLGVEFIPLSQALKDPVYETDPGISFPKWGAELEFQVLKAEGKKVTDLGLEPYKGYPKEKLESICR